MKFIAANVFRVSSEMVTIAEKRIWIRRNAQNATSMPFASWSRLWVAKAAVASPDFKGTDTFVDRKFHAWIIPDCATKMRNVLPVPRDFISANAGTGLSATVGPVEVRKFLKFFGDFGIQGKEEEEEGGVRRALGDPMN